jgi:hypothetical protein
MSAIGAEPNIKAMPRADGPEAIDNTEAGWIIERRRKSPAEWRQAACRESPVTP